MIQRRDRLNATDTRVDICVETRQEEVRTGKLDTFLQQTCLHGSLAGERKEHPRREREKDLDKWRKAY